jgi:nitrogen fixation protein FixH
MRTRQAHHLPSGWAWFPWAIGGALGITFAVNATLIYLAGHTFPGEAASKPYEVGTAYNRVLADAARQAELGWQLTSEVEQGAVVLKFVDKNGAPIENLAITATLVRPVGSPEATVLSFTPASDGVYKTAQRVPAAGQWDLKLIARQKGEPIYNAARRLVAP